MSTDFDLAEAYKTWDGAGDLTPLNMLAQKTLQTHDQVATSTKYQVPLNMLAQHTPIHLVYELYGAELSQSQTRPRV